MQSVAGTNRLYMGQRMLSETESTNRKNYLTQLSSYERARPGENRSQAVQLAIEAYDKSLNSAETDSIVLDLSTCGEITECPPLFFGLTDLNLSNTRVTKLPADIPKSLKHLNLSNSRVEYIPNDLLPDGLECLNLCNAQAMTKLPSSLPKCLKELEINWTSLRGIPPGCLPEGLEILKMSGISIFNLQDGSIPDSVRIWDISNNSISTLPDRLPSCLESFNLSNTSVSVIPDGLPQGLNTINIAGTRVASINNSNLTTDLDVIYSANSPYAEWMSSTVSEIEVNEEEVAIWDEHVNDKVQEDANKNLVVYQAEGGVHALFSQQNSGDEVVKNINSLIAENQLKSENAQLSVSGIVLHFTEDVVTTEEFGEKPQTEWCLLSKGGNHYSLITANSLKKLIESGSKNPNTRQLFTVDGFIRGKAIVDLLSATVNDSEKVVKK